MTHQTHDCLSHRDFLLRRAKLQRLVSFDRDVNRPGLGLRHIYIFTRFRGWRQVNFAGADFVENFPVARTLPFHEDQNCKTFANRAGALRRRQPVLTRAWDNPATAVWRSRATGMLLLHAPT